MCILKHFETLFLGAIQYNLGAKQLKSGQLLLLFLNVIFTTHVLSHDQSMTLGHQN